MDINFSVQHKDESSMGGVCTLKAKLLIIMAPPQLSYFS